MANYNWYKESYRRNLVDMHIEDWDETFLSVFDPQVYIDCMKRGHIKSVMIYLQSHTGLCNFPTKTGRVHKAFERENKIGTLFDLCRTEGMDAVGYYSLIFNNWAYDTHPEWRMVDIFGKTSRDPDSFFSQKGRYGVVCPNNNHYRTFVSAQLEELFDLYDMDGIFLDMAFWPTACTCSSCRERYVRETGNEIPVVIDFADPNNLLFQQRREAWMREFAHFAANECRRLRPGIPVEHNNSTLPICWALANDGGTAEASDFVGGDLYCGPFEQSVLCKFFYEYSNNQPFEYMTSRCSSLVKEHTTTKSTELLKLQNDITLAHHGATLFIDAIDPCGTMHPKVYDRLGEVFRQGEPYEQAMAGDMVSDVAIYFDLKSKMRFQPGDPGPIDTYPQYEALMEGARALSKGNYLYTVIPNERREKILGKKVVIVTEAFLLSDDDVNFLADYVQGGGNLYISGSCNPKLVNRLLSLEFLGWTDSRQTYVAPTPEGASFFGELTCADHPLSLPNSQMRMRNGAGNKVLATITLPYTNPNDPARFASIHADPPGIRTEDPSIVYGEYGSGKVLWTAGAFENHPSLSHKDVFLNLLALLYDGESRLTSNAPECVQFTLFDDPEHRRLLLHAVNVQQAEPFFRAGDFDVALSTDRSVHRVRCLPDGGQIAFSIKNGVLSFSLRDMDLFTTIEIVYG